MMAANDRGGTRWDNLCPSYTAGITKEDVAEFWRAQPFDLGMDSDFGNCDLCWKKNEGKLIKTIIEDPSRVIWWSGTEERFGQVFRQDRADYKTMGGQLSNVPGRPTSILTISPKTSTAFVAIDLDHLFHSLPLGFQNLLRDLY